MNSTRVKCCQFHNLHFFTSAGRLVQHVSEAVPLGGVELNHLFVLGDLPLPIFPARLHVANSSRDIPRYRFVLRGVPLETDFSHDQFVLRAKKYCYRIHNGFETDSYWIHHGFITGSHIGFIFIMDSQWIHKSAKAFIHSFVGTTAFILRVDGY